ncbi:carbohydrate kinase family protein [Halonotius terrestris]|uniref:carbohydrate kinase family protein n=1 Tax=Halonotius terrestris TaxID=2487750 RepID=UPI00163B7F33|nr:PfkB family carbohydrate kinase [Halonotius terrestris]
MTILCAGHINWDVTIHVDGLPEPDGEVQIQQLIQSGGGSAANVAVGLVGLDVPAALYGSVGGDDTGALALRELDRAGVDCGHVVIDPETTTSVKYLVVDAAGEVMVFSNEGANESFRAVDVDSDLLSGVDHLHLTGQSPETASLLAMLASDMGLTVSFDPGRRISERAYGDTLAATDLLFLNDREAARAEAAGLLTPTDPSDTVVVVKHGGEGAAVHTPTGRVSHPGFAIEPVDQTGAGDAFAAGFLASVFGGDDSAADGPTGVDTVSPPLDDAEWYSDALAVGNACGALAAESMTARTELSWDAIEELLASHQSE